MSLVYFYLFLLVYSWFLDLNKTYKSGRVGIIMVDNFIWRKVSEKEKGEIEKNAKKILNDFASKLANIKTKDSHFENGDGGRDEGEGWKTDEMFRELMMENAPFVEGDLVVAEKGGWK